ncbi:MAG TPA: GNAT family N-acetyltransferase [Microthrixaceae bacterium]|nr:GNAT family N-acetyltransferase [Microthrixaceae bacterium]
MPLDRQPLLAGERLELRPLRPDDFDDLYAIASDPLLWEQHPSKDRTERAVFQHWFDDAMASGGALVAIDRSDGIAVGTSRFANYDAERREVEIGWTFLRRSHWGGVYNGELKRLMLEHAFEAVDAVVFRIHSDNVRSQRAVEKLGATRVGTEEDPHGRGENHVFRLESAEATLGSG